MQYYKFMEGAGYYGNGGWAVFYYDHNGHICVTKVFGSEEECLKHNPRLKKAN